jgi:hypothetical protein
MRSEDGFTYLTVLFLVALLGLGLARAGQVWRTAAMREREAELLYVGNQYRLAIERYYKHGMLQYPQKIDDLLEDPRYPEVERYLRRPYFDPMTGKDEWGLVKAPDGGIMGVYSLSEDKPFKIAGFGVENQSFEGAGKYSDWKFVYTPSLAQKVVPAAPATPPPQPTPATLTPPGPALLPAPVTAPAAEPPGPMPAREDGRFDTLPQ